MKLGFVSAILPEQSLQSVLQCAVEIGYDCVELMCWPRGKADRRYAGVTHIDVTDFTEDQAAQTLELCESAGVSISGLGYYPNPLSPDHSEATTAIRHLEQVVQAAALLGVQQVNTFIGRDWSRTVDANWQRFLSTWKPLVSVAESLGVRIAIENCPMLFTDDEWPGGKNLATSPAIWRRMFDAIPSPSFGLNYDPSHLVWQQMDYLAPIEEFHERFFHVHAKDVAMDQNRLNDVGILATPNEYHCPKLPGLGDIDWSKFFSLLGDAGYDGPVCVEVEDRDFEATLALRKQALQQSHDYLRNSIASQRT